MQQFGQIARFDDEPMRAMLAARKEVFVDLLGWDLPTVDGTYELDQYDGPDADYLILLDEDGRHRASARLLRTDRPHLLGDVYPQLCDGPLPSGPTVREITRFCLDRKQGAADRRLVRNQLITALAEHALRTGLTGYVGIADLSWFAQILGFGWRCMPLGRAYSDGRRMLAALHIEIDGGTLSGLRRKHCFEPITYRLIDTNGKLP